jgi:hypothetical protein
MRVPTQVLPLLLESKMFRVPRVSIAAVLALALATVPFSGVASADDLSPAPSGTVQRIPPPPIAGTVQPPPTRSRFVVSDEMLARITMSPEPGVSAYGQWGRRRGYGRRGRNGGAQAAVILGAAAAIAGTALLVYANRPECGDTPGASGCSYGTKVVGGSLVAGGAVSVAVGAAGWR